MKFPFDNNVVFAHFQIKTQITEIRRPYTIILAYMIILISKMGNPTRLFHTAQLFESAECLTIFTDTQCWCYCMQLGMDGLTSKKTSLNTIRLTNRGELIIDRKINSITCIIMISSITISEHFCKKN